MSKQTFIPGPPKVGDTVMVRTMEKIPFEALNWAFNDGLESKEEYEVEFIGEPTWPGDLGWIRLKGKRYFHHPDRFIVVFRPADTIINASQTGSQC